MDDESAKQDQEETKKEGLERGDAPTPPPPGGGKERPDERDAGAGDA